MQKAFFFDVDGTLVSFKTHKVSEQSKDVIKKLRERGHKVFIATGRMLPMLDDVLKGITFDGYITYNGACCVDSEKKEIIHKEVIPRKTLEKLAQRLESDKFPVAFMCRHDMYVNYMDDVVIKVADIIGVDLPTVKPIEEIIKEDVYQICIYADDEKMVQIINEVMPDCEFARWMPLFVDVNLKGVSKRVGIDKMIEHFGISLEDTVAFGDGGNDILMLKHVKLGIAMGNASDKVKAAADYVTSDVDDEGVSEAIESLFL